jgi:sulfate adenylyltransferase
LTGLSGAGKSTIAENLEQRLQRRGRLVTVLDGDVVRTNLSHGLGFTKADRDTNVRRIGFVAAEVVRHGGAVIVAAVSPYEAAREDARHLVSPGRFVLAFVDTPLSVCEQRDVKALYARARRGEIPAFTGIDDPYEVPSAPDIVLDTLNSSAEDCAAHIEALLIERRFLPSIRLVARHSAFATKRTRAV